MADPVEPTQGTSGSDTGIYIQQTHNPTTMVEMLGNANTINRVGKDTELNKVLHTDLVYNALLNAAECMENRLNESLRIYQEHPDVQANLQQLQYDLQMWNLALTTMSNINKNMGDALNDIAGNFR